MAGNASISAKFLPFPPPPPILFAVNCFQTESAVRHRAGVACCCCWESKAPSSNSNRVCTSSPNTPVISTSRHRPSSKGSNTDRRVMSKGAKGDSSQRKLSSKSSRRMASTSSREMDAGHCNEASKVASLLLNSSWQMGGNGGGLARGECGPAFLNPAALAPPLIRQKNAAH